MAEATAGYKIIGTRPVRPDGADKVTGRAIYGGDMRLTGMLHGRVLRSPHAHARIKSIDTSKAEALSGVRAVVTTRDLPAPQDRMAGDFFPTRLVLPVSLLPHKPCWKKIPTRRSTRCAIG